MKDFLEELKWRGLIHDLTPGVEEQLQKEMTLGYIGFDPTSDSLHIGNMLQVMLLSIFQKCGHQPVVLIGGATGMVGDPSGKSKERKFLDEDLLIHNQNKIKKQFETFLDFLVLAFPAIVRCFPTSLMAGLTNLSSNLFMLISYINSEFHKNRNRYKNKNCGGNYLEYGFTHSRLS